MDVLRVGVRVREVGSKADVEAVVPAAAVASAVGKLMDTVGKLVDAATVSKRREPSGDGGRQGRGTSVEGMGKRRCATDEQAREGQGRASRPSAHCPFGRKLGSNLGREWVESGQKTDDSPFAAAHWEA